MGANNKLKLLLNNAITQHRLPGLAVVIHQDGQEVFAAGYGHRDAARQHAITPDTMFGVASVTKMITAMMVMKLAEQHRLSVSDAVATHYGALEIAHTTPMQLAHLLSHCAGFPGLPCRFKARNIAHIADDSGGVSSRHNTSRVEPYKDIASVVSADELVDLINRLKIEPLATPGKLLNYSNESYCLLGGIVEKLQHCTYLEAAQQMIFTPLDMTCSTVGGQHLADFDNVANPLRRNEDGFNDAEIWEAPLFYSAGGVISSARDLIKLIQVFDTTSTLLDDNSRTLMTAPHMSVASRIDHSVHSAYGFGLEVESIDVDTTMLWHTGQRAGVSSFVGRLVKQQIDVAVLCNVADAPTAAIGHSLIAQILQRDDIVWPPLKTAGKQSTSNQSLELKQSEIQRFQGFYSSAEGFEFHVEMQAGGLVLCRSSIRERLVFLDHDSGNAGDQTFRFLADDDQAPWALALDLRIFRRQF